MREGLVSPLLSGLVFAYVAIFMFSLMPDWGINLGFVQVLGVSAGATALLNLWSLYRGGGVFTRKKRRRAIRGMAWSFVVLSAAMVPLASAESVTVEMVRDTASLGLWTWITYFFGSQLYEKHVFRGPRPGQQQP